MAFSLTPSPTFWADVEVPISGDAPEVVQFQFRHRTRDAFDAMAAKIADKTLSIDDAVRDVVVGWRVPGLEFTPDALSTCFQVHPGSPIAIWFGYRKALIEGVRKN